MEVFRASRGQACRYHRLMPTGGPVRAMGMASDAEGNIWISSVGNNSVYVFKHGNPHQSVRFDQQLGSRPFDIAIAADGSAWVSNGLGPPPATIAKYALVNGALVQRFRHLLGDQLRGIPSILTETPGSPHRGRPRVCAWA